MLNMLCLLNFLTVMKSFLAVNHKNTTAQKLYLKVGFPRYRKEEKWANW